MLQHKILDTIWSGLNAICIVFFWSSMILMRCYWAWFRRVTPLNIKLFYAPLYSVGPKFGALIINSMCDEIQGDVQVLIRGRKLCSILFEVPFLSFKSMKEYSRRSENSPPPGYTRGQYFKTIFTIFTFSNEECCTINKISSVRSLIPSMLW